MRREMSPESSLSESAVGAEGLLDFVDFLEDLDFTEDEDLAASASAAARPERISGTVWTLEGSSWGYMRKERGSH
jgi:hypothetical protein